MSDVLIESDGMAAATAALTRVRMLPHPFSVERVEKHVDAGQTIYEMMGAAGCRPGRAYIVLLNGEFIPPELWKRIRPKPRAELIIKAVPMDSGNGDENKTLRTILQVVVLIVAIVLVVLLPEISPIIIMGAAAVLNLAITALLPPKFPKPKTPGGPEEPGFALSGARNTANPGGPLPRVYGKHKMFPFYASRPFTEIVGEKQYLRMLFTCGYGPLQITGLRIGETPIEEFSGVELEIREGGASDLPLTLFSDTILEETLTILLQPNVPQIRTTEAFADEISVDFVFPGGLFDFGRAQEPRSVTWRVEYSPAGADTWTARPGLNRTAATSQPLRIGDRWKVTRGQYDVRVTRLTRTLGKSNIAEDLYWSAIRTVRYPDPIPEPRMSKIALRIRATDQLNGVIDTLSCLVEAKLRTWNGTSWDATPTVTRNPAAAYLDILTGIANKRPVADSRVDLAGLGAWYTACASAARNYDAVIDYRSTVFECLHDVAVAGRAGFAMPDGKYGVVRDIPQSVPVQIFTPRNSWGFTGRKLFPDHIDGFRMPFIDATSDYQASEVLVHDDGVDPLTASVYEVLQIPGITSPSHLWKEGRYHLACARLRPELWELYADVENLVCQRGDLVQVLHDVLLVGLSAGRVKTVTLNGAGAATSVTVDELLTMEAATNYGIKFRRPDGTYTNAQVVTVVGEDQASVTFTAPIAAASIPAVGDLFVFGVLGTETVDALVKAVMPGRDLSARLELVPAATGVHTADTGTIPPYDPGITLPPHLRPPPSPRVDAVVSEGVTTSTPASAMSRVTVLWSLVGGDNLELATLQAAWRESNLGAEDPWVPVAPLINMDAMTLDVEPLTPGTTVDVRIRTVSRFGVPSAWVTVFGIALSNPPSHATYTLTPVTGGYRASRFRRVGAPTPPRVTGLRLVNGINHNSNDTIFGTGVAKFTWNAVSQATGLGDEEDNLTNDPDVSYRVEIVSGSVVKFTANPTSPGFDYTYALNVEDHNGSPVRTFAIRVYLRTAAGLDGPPATLTVRNLAPTMAGFFPTVSQRPGGVLVDWRAFTWTDTDREKYDVLLDTVNPPLLVKATVTWKTEAVLIPDQPTGTTLYARIVPHDVFGPGTASGVTVFFPPISALTGFNGVAKPGGIQLTWARITAANFEAVEVWRSTTNDVATAQHIGDGNRTGYLDTNEDIVSGVPYYYWGRPRDTADPPNFAPFHTGATNGARVVLPPVVGFSHIGSVASFTAGTQTLLSAAVDIVSGEVDALAVATSTSDIYWGETSLTGGLKTALVAKFVGTFQPREAACCFANNDMQVVVYEGAGSLDLKYGRISADGTVEQALVAFHTPVVNGLGPWPAVAYDSFNNSGFYVLWPEDSAVGVGGLSRIKLMKLGGTGAVVLAATTVLTAAVGYDKGYTIPYAAVDGDGNIHTIWWYIASATDFAIHYIKIGPTGTVLAGPTVLDSYVLVDRDQFPVGIFVDSTDNVFPLTVEAIPVGGSLAPSAIFKIGRLSKDGLIRVPLTRFLTSGTEFIGAAVVHNRSNDSWTLLHNTGTNTITSSNFVRAAV